MKGAISGTSAGNEQEAVSIATEELDRRRGLARLAAVLGSSDGFLSREELVRS